MAHNMSVSVGSRFSVGDLRTEQGCRHAFNRLLAMSDEELAQQDIAVMNLLCATGLPSSDPLDITECLTFLDNWANYAYREILRGELRYRANPDPNKGSENLYRLYAMMHAIRALSGIERKFMSGKGVVDLHLIDTSMKPTGGPYKNRVNSQVGFIHGLLSDRCLGCCASNPILFAAIGRRLGFPVKVVTTVQHLFNRWVDENEQFNMDGSMKVIGRDDDHDYIDRWRPWRDFERAALNKTLHVPMTPRQELAAFMFERSICLSANLRFEEAKEACTIAHKMSPDNPAFSSELETIETFFAHRERRMLMGLVDGPVSPASKIPQPSAPSLTTVQPTQPLNILNSSPSWGLRNVKFVYQKRSPKP